MEEFSARDAGVKVGLEIHQQLATNKKLFCGCVPIESDEYAEKFQRRLRISKSEMGELDPAALFESAKSETVSYFANPQSSCLVEQDEEPPHRLDVDAKEIALLIAATLKSKTFSEILPMRKTVIDGSNTSGFQRTMLVSQGGYYEAEGMRIGIQSVCLEEDAARIIKDGASTRSYGLERLGVPLVEIATEPFEAEPRQIKGIALALGRILRSTKRVRRGIGTIRQDVNVSIRGGGAVVEVKGVQQLDQLEGVVEFEARRQHGLLRISQELQSRDWPGEGDRYDITDPMGGCGSKIVQAAIKKGHRVWGVAFRNLSGMFGFMPHEGIRLGREVADMSRFFGMGGVFHSDELPGYGIDASDVDRVKKAMRIGGSDAFLMLAAPEDRMQGIIDQMILRIRRIRDSGVPADTRMATQAGETRFLRPRPGAARMYPETDVPPITISEQDLRAAGEKIPKPWDEAVRDIQNRYRLNAQLAEQIFDSDHLGLFERICGSTKNPPNFVASTLCSTITSLERRGLDRSRLSERSISDVFDLLDREKIPKESVGLIFEGIMSGKPADAAIREASEGTLSDEELDSVLKMVVKENMNIVETHEERAIGPLMGSAMKELRGRTSGEKISRRLQEMIQEALEGYDKN